MTKDICTALFKECLKTELPCFYVYTNILFQVKKGFKLAIQSLEFAGHSGLIYLKSDIKIPFLKFILWLSAPVFS